MKTKNLLVSMLIFLGLLGYIRWVEMPKQEAELSVGKVFPGVLTNDLEKIEITGKYGTIAFKNGSYGKEENKTGPTPTDLWELADVPGSELDASTIGNLINLILELKLEDPIKESELEKDLSVYGFDKPEMQIKVSIPKLGDAKDIIFGKYNTYFSKRYIKLSSSSEIYLNPHTLFTQADKRKLDFRKLNPITFIDSELASLKISDKRSSLKFVQKDKDSSWRLSEPGDYSVDTAAFTNLTNELRTVRADDFIDDLSKLAEYKLLEPELKLVLEYDESVKREALEISVSKRLEEKRDKDGKPDGKEERSYVYLKGKPSIYKVSKDLIAALFKPVNDYREKQLFQFLVDNVTAAEFEGSVLSSPLKLAKQNEGWTLNDKSADSNFVQELLRELTKVEARSFVEVSTDLGFSAPILKAKITESGTASVKQERILIVGRKITGKGKKITYYVGVDDLKEPFIIDSDQFAKITPRVEVLLKSEKVGEGDKS